MNARVMILSSLAAMLALAGAMQGQGHPYVLTDLGTVAGNTSPLAWGINETGDTTVGWFYWPVLGWVHTPSGMSLVGTLPGCAYSSARDVNDSGQIVGSSWVATINQPGHAYRLTPGTGMVDLGTLGGASSEAWRINNSGDVVGNSLVAGDNSNRAFLYTDGAGMVNLAPQAAISYAHGISHNGQATGSMTVGNNWHAFRYIPGVGLSDLGVPPGFAHSYGYAINDFGQVAGTVSTSGSTYSTLFRWTPGSGFEIFGSAAPFTSAWAINASGTVVGVSPVGGVYRAVMYADGLGMVDLNTLINPATGMTLRSAGDINDRGQIVGYGLLPNGETHSYRLDPAVAPSILFAGPGCASGLPPALSSTLPHLAQAVTLMVAQAQPSLTGDLVVSGIPAASLPLGGGCVAYVDVASFVTLAPIATDAAGNWLTTLTIPNAPILVGAQFALQGALYPTSGPLGVDLTNGLFLTIGN